MSEELPSIILGTRGGALALAQAEMTEAALQAHAPDLGIERKIIKTTGDRRTDVPLSEVASAEGHLDKGVFIKELELALEAGEIDVAVHSLKDMPSVLEEGFEIAAVLPRAPVGDVLVTKKPGGLGGLPPGALVATSSVRRQRMLMDVRPDLLVVDIRGNVPTRLRKLRESEELAGLLLAEAGLHRLGLLHGETVRSKGLSMAAEVLDMRLFLPAAGQGAVALETRRDDEPVRNLIESVNDPETFDAVRAERKFLELLGAGCDTPVGVLSRIDRDHLFLRAIVFEEDETQPLIAEIAGLRADLDGVAKAAAGEFNAKTIMTGKCYLVGAGPGDPGLITVKGRECLEKADVLIYDALSSIEFLRWVPKNCEKIYAGKRAKAHAIPQDEINALIVEKAQAGKTVVRLKGGDPMIFGRGGEEAAELAEAGVPFEIVPGISSAIGGVAYAGIPVTHRDHCSQLTLFTGHEDPTKEDSSLDYAKLAQADGTKVFLMGVSRLREITDALIANGADQATPMALIRWATTGRQWTLEGTLGTMADLAEKEQFSSPAVAVIGSVVTERQKINWFESRPLFGKRIVVTRTREQAGELSARLLELGADVVELPTIRIDPPRDIRAFAHLVQDVHTYDWVVFTSPNGVERFFEGFYAAYPDARSFGKPRIAAIGPSTAKKIAEYRFTTDLMPEKFVAEGLVEAFKKQDIASQTVLWVKAEETRDVIYEELMNQGAIVDKCIAYRTVPETEDPTGAAQRIREEGAEVVTFASGSTVENFFKLGIPWPEGCQAASIGPITSEALRDHGQENPIEAAKSDIPGLVDAIVKALTK